MGPLGCSVGSRTLFFWLILLISSRWAYEVAPQELAWVGCSKPLCFTRFWARSGCGGLAWGRAWGALGASPGASRGLSGAHRDPQGGLQRRLWQLLGDSGDLWGSWLRSSGFLFGAVLAVPSVPQGCLRASLGVPLRTARGTQKGPPYRRDLLFLGSLWGPLGCSVGSRTLFFWPILMISSRWAYEVAPQELA